MNFDTFSGVGERESGLVGQRMDECAGIKK